MTATHAELRSGDELCTVAWDILSLPRMWTGPQVPLERSRSLYHVEAAAGIGAPRSKWEI